MARRKTVMQQYFFVVAAGKPPIPLLPYDRLGKPRVEDGEKLFLLPEAARRSGFSERCLLDLWMGTWAEFVASDEPEPPIEVNTTPAVDPAEAPKLPKDDQPNLSNLDDHGCPVRVGAVVVIDGPDNAIVEVVKDGAVILRSLRWEDGTKKGAECFGCLCREVTVILDPPAPVPPMALPPIAAAGLVLMQKIAHCRDQCAFAKGALIEGDHMHSCLKGAQEHLNDAIGELIDVLMWNITPYPASLPLADAFAESRKSVAG